MKDERGPPLALSWARLGLGKLGLSPDLLQQPLDDKLVVTTGCSGTGAPTLALVELVGQSNLVEIAASERH
ncbi:unnamed protein product, partial [Durusdinium trenchii]